MAVVFDERERELVGTALEALVPGAVELGALDYVEQLLGALDHDPPRIWAAPSGHPGGWLELGPWERHAWGQRIASWRAVYQRVIDGEPQPGDHDVLHAHACEAVYGDPAYGGNRAGGGWQRIEFPEPLFPPQRDAP